MLSPFIENRADPMIIRGEDGLYRFVASVPEFDRIELRQSATLHGLRDAKPRVIWRRHESGEMSSNIWAPEIHRVFGSWYVYFAAASSGADKSGIYDHRTYALKCEGDDPMTAEFTEAGRIDTGWSSFTLDSTTFELNKKRYFVWAQRDYSIAGNSNLYIAEMLSPTKLRLPAAMLSRPEYDWECQGFLVNEGPFVLRHAGKLFLTYSGSATDERYAIGMLAMDESSDPLLPASWTKSAKPVMVTEAENGLFGPGHNCFTKDESGNDILVFHARPYAGFHGSALSDPNRHTYLREVKYDESGLPIFQSR
ncbi:MAG: family 43 glycosylhydrolase [Eubacteriales bacterium]|nr:family 43 glycosylhydrolase [Eubacteriales bacterium]MDD3880998.1 family 43 glycosylhydrolase [Eubacteriales bacterium]MDD4511933.1 family 43 glycosylhydrolase [Eubacteriales bacterium]